MSKVMQWVTIFMNFPWEMLFVTCIQFMLISNKSMSNSARICNKPNKKILCRSSLGLSIHYRLWSGSQSQWPHYMFYIDLHYLFWLKCQSSDIRRMIINWHLEVDEMCNSIKIHTITFLAALVHSMRMLKVFVHLKFFLLVHNLGTKCVT